MPWVQTTAAGAASDRLGLPRPGQAFALSHFRVPSRSAPHWTGREQDKAGSGDGDNYPWRFDKFNVDERRRANRNARAAARIIPPSSRRPLMTKTIQPVPEDNKSH